jgi:transcriptional regulator with PAS, ATPase and Fis domain
MLMTPTATEERLRGEGGAPATRAPFHRLIGESDAMLRIKELLGKIARSPASTVLLCGESGTGKGLMAKEIHAHSDRSRKAFQNINCSALPDTLLESELFGYERGAFTDAKSQKKGLLEEADGGTVFLDEIGEVGPASQVKLLRFLEERAFKRLGGTADITVDVRVIAATNRNLEQAVQAGEIRQDLYYRLRVLPVNVPPLRQRIGDVGRLAEHFVAVFNRLFHKHVRGLSAAALAVLAAHSWPGNVRELRNVVERAMLLAEHDVLTPEDFRSLSRPVPRERRFELPAEGVDFDALERDFVSQALERAQGNRTRAARLLGWSRHQIQYRIAKFGLLAPVPRIDGA